MPAYASAGTQSFAVTINGTPVEGNQIRYTCYGASCTFTFPAPAGKDVFVITLGDANFNVLSQGTVTATVVSGQTTTLHLTFHGAPAFVLLGLDTPNPPVGSPATAHLTATAYDASGNQIIGDDYLTPISVSAADADGHTSLSGTQLVNPTSSITVTYDGKTMSSPLTLTVSSPQSPSNKDAIFLANAYQTFSTAYTVKSLAKGPDGNVWFTECGSNAFGSCKVGYVTPSGQVTESANVQWAEQIAPGPDGNMWFTEDSDGYVDRVSPSMAITRFQLKALGPNEGFYSGPLVAAPDGTLWIAEGDNLTQMNTAGQVLQQASIGCGWCYPGQVIVAANNTLWVSELGYISNVTLAGAVTDYQLFTNTPNVGIVDATGLLPLAGGDVLFQYYGLKRITSGGAISSVTLDPSVKYFGSFVTLGPDGNVWGNGTVSIGAAGTISGVAALNLSTGKIIVYPPIDSSYSAGLGSAAWGADGNLYYLGVGGIAQFRFVH